ncbi:hypothetical protein N7494_001751 [Penicillium frequentans]|uniref:FAR1 domain-containing protein n=1 Tax=Penicillium frequentans TaxID=3151616 RepID=A0AAD6GJ93_9EURO|nr:hypothetical protein N7494_001751 [Penicillium glabrum]
MSLTFIILILIFMSTQSIPHSPEMTLPDTKNYCLDSTVNNIDHEALKMETHETIKTEIKEEVQNGFNEIPMYTLTAPHSAEMLLPSPKAGHSDSTVDSIENGVLKCDNEESIKMEIEDSSQVDSKEEIKISSHTTQHSPPNSNVNYFDISSDSAKNGAIKEEIKEATREAIGKTKEKASRKATKRKIDEILDDEGSADVNLVAPVPSNTVILPVDQTWDSLEEAYEAILDFIHRQGYGATYYRKWKRFSRPSDTRIMVSRQARNLPNEYVHLGCDVVELKTGDQVNENGKPKKTIAKKTSTCSFGAIVMKCLDCWRIVTIFDARHSHEPLPPKALPSQHRLERKRKAALIYQMIQEGFNNGRILQQIQLQDPKTCLDRVDIKYLRLLPKKKHKSELWIQLQKGAIDDEAPSLEPSLPQNLAIKGQLERNTKRAYIIQQVQQGLSNEAIVQQHRIQDPNSCLDRLNINQMRMNQERNQDSALYSRQLTGTTDDDLPSHGALRQFERNMKKAYIFQQMQQGLSNMTILQQIRLQDPNSYLDSIDITNMRACLKRRQINALIYDLQGQDLKGSTDIDPTEDHQLSKAESDDGLAEDYKLLVEKVSDEKDCKLPKTEMDDDLAGTYEFLKKEIHDEKDYKLPKEEMNDQNYKLPKEEMYDDLARV